MRRGPYIGLFLAGLLATAACVHADSSSSKRSDATSLPAKDEPISAPVEISLPPTSEKQDPAASTEKNPAVGADKASPAAQTLGTLTVNGDDDAGKKLKKPRPEPPVDHFVRTGTIAEKVGKKVTSKLWVKGDRGIMASFSW